MRRCVFRPKVITFSGANWAVIPVGNRLLSRVAPDLGAIYFRDRMALVDAQEVVLLGDRRTGAFLLPAVPNLLVAWREWIKGNSPVA